MLSMRTILASGLFSLLIGLTMTQPAHAETDPTGLWLTQNKRSVVSVEPCQENKSMMCGYIHWIIEGGMQFDDKNPDAALHNRPMCGLPIIYGLKKLSANEWGDGKIYKADEGDVYDGQMEMNDDGTLAVSGYVGIPLFGKEQTWTRVNASDYPKCKRAKR